MNNYSKVLGEMLQLGKNYKVNRRKLNNDLVYKAIVKFFAEQDIIERKQGQDINLTTEECKVIFRTYQDNCYDYKRFLKLYDWRQIREILIGLKKRVDISLYNNPEFNHEQMREIRLGLERGLDIKKYAKKELSSSQMRNIRLKLEKKI